MDAPLQGGTTDGTLTRAALSNTDRVGHIYTRSSRTGLLAPRPGFSARRTLPIKPKELGKDWEHAQGSFHWRRPSLSEDALTAGRGWGQSLATQPRCHRDRAVSPGTHLDGSSRAGGRHVDGYDLRPLSGDSKSSGSETLFDTAGRPLPPRSTSATFCMPETSTAPAVVTAVALANSPFR